MKLFLWMAGLFGFTSILGIMIGAEEGTLTPQNFLMGGLITGGFVALLLLAWWLSREAKSKP